MTDIYYRCILISEVKERHTERRYKMTFIIKKTANIITVTSECGTIFKSWIDFKFTERKLENTIKKITKDLNGNANFIRTF